MIARLRDALFDAAPLIVIPFFAAVLVAVLFGGTWLLERVSR